MWSRLTFTLPVLLAACLAGPKDQAAAAWSDVQFAEDEAEKVAAARLLATNATPDVAFNVANSLGAYVGSDAEVYLAVAVARNRPDGLKWLARRTYGMSLDDAFSDILSGGEPIPRLDWVALADALVVAMPDDGEASRWLALMSIAEDGESSDRVRELLTSDMSVRARVRSALDARDMPTVLPAELLAAFGTPQDEDEESWLTRAYRRAFASALDDAPISETDHWDDLEEAWTTAFPDAAVPVEEDDRVIVDALPDILSPVAEPSEDTPPFRDVAAFMIRHQRTEWSDLLAAYQRWHALPSNALSYVCRVSADECSEALRSGIVKNVASAADVAPALDLEHGDGTLITACDALSHDEARLLAERGRSNGAPFAIRESALTCLTILGDSPQALWADLVSEAAGTHRWIEAEDALTASGIAVSPEIANAALEAMRDGTVAALDIPVLLGASTEGAALLFSELPEAQRGVLGGKTSGVGVAEMARKVRTKCRARVIVLEVD